jgi:UDP-glucose 4-epimerase
VSAGLAGEALTIYGNGEQTRSFADVRMFVPQVLALEQAWAQKAVNHYLYNVGTSVETSINGLADAVDRVLGRKIVRRHVPYEAAFPGKQDVERRRPDLRRIDTVLAAPVWPTLDESIHVVAEALAGSRVSSVASGRLARRTRRVLN